MKLTGLAHARLPNEARDHGVRGLKAAGRTVVGNLRHFAAIKIFDSDQRAGGRA